MNIRFSELLNEVAGLKETLDKLLTFVKPNEELWDNADIIQNWKVSERTLADWRKKGLISYVQVQNKIWYPKSARDEFLAKNLVANDKQAEYDMDDFSLRIWLN